MFSRHIFAACNRYHPNFSWSDVDRSQFLQVNRTVCSQHLSNVFIGFRRFSSAQVFKNVFSSDSHVFPKEKPHLTVPCPPFRPGAEAPNTQRPRFAAKAQRLSVELRDVRGEASCLHAMASAHDIVDQCLGDRILDEKNGSGEYGNLWESMGTYGNLWKPMRIYGISMFFFEWKSMSPLGEQWFMVDISRDNTR